MKTYLQFRPTAFDRPGISLPDRQTWFVAPVIQTRDSGPLEQSNFAACLKALGGESDTVEVHSFNHWGPGWFDIILIDPMDTERVRIAQEIEDRLSDYPVIDEHDLSEREWQDYVETWQNCRMGREFARAIVKAFETAGAPLSQTLAWFLGDDVDGDKWREIYQELTPSGDYFDRCENGANFGRRIERAADAMSRDHLARIVRQARRELRKATA